MDLFSLPTEILDLIIDFILPESWSNNLRDPPWLNIRLVCSKYNYHQESQSLMTIRKTRRHTLPPSI